MTDEQIPDIKSNCNQTCDPSLKYMSQCRSDYKGCIVTSVLAQFVVAEPEIMVRHQTFSDHFQQMSNQLSLIRHYV